MSEITVAEAIVATEFLMTDWGQAGEPRGIVVGRHSYVNLVRFYCGPLVRAVPLVLGAATFEALLRSARITCNRLPDDWDGWGDLVQKMRDQGRVAKANYGLIASRSRGAAAHSLLAADPFEAWLDQRALDLMEDCHAEILARARASESGGKGA